MKLNQSRTQFQKLSKSGYALTQQFFEEFQKGHYLNVVRINFEDMCLCLSNSEKQYKCPRDDRQTGGNTDVPQFKRQLFSGRPPQDKIQEVKILLTIPNLPRPPGFLQSITFNTLHLTVQFLHCPAILP